MHAQWKVERREFNMFEFKTLLVERPLDCPMCGHDLKMGDVMYQDDYRNETLCGYCKENYIEEVVQTEGENGEYLR